MMASFLLDTHTLLWYLDQSDELSERAFQLITDTDHLMFVSVASYWEMTIKASLGKLDLPNEIDLMIQHAEEANFQTLPIQPAHLATLHNLPFHHRDPFDRLMLAQAKAEGMQIISRDETLRAYAVSVTW